MNITNRITSASFSACVTSKDGLPKDDLPIIALVGRSNVGKSSLINSLTGRKELARTSSMPGKTLTMNFYCINDAFYIVDLPGYGYAKASKATRAKIQLMMDEFFVSCANLKGVIQVVDIRHKPSPLDLQMHNWLREQHLNGFVVLTKLDKLSNQQAIKMRSIILKEIRGVYTVNYSSKSLLGRDDFLDAVEKILAGYEFKVADVKSKRASRESEGGEEGSLEENNIKTPPLTKPSMTGETFGHRKKEVIKSGEKEVRSNKGGYGRERGNRNNRSSRSNYESDRQDRRERFGNKDRVAVRDSGKNNRQAKAERGASHIDKQ